MVVRHRRWLVAGAILLVGVVSASVARFWSEPAPVALVRDYYEAIRERKVEEALRLAGGQRPRGERARFLVPEAMDGGLEIAEITVVSERNDGEYTDMLVTFEARDGVPLGKQVRVLKEEDGLRIAYPFVTVAFKKTALRYAEVGKVRIPFVAGDEDWSVAYDLFPGNYSFYERSSDLVRVRGLRGAGLVMTDWIAPVPQITLTPAGQQAVTRAFNSFIDECARKGGIRPRGCPFGRDAAGPGVRWRGPAFPELRQTSWRVLRYPTVVAAQGNEGLDLNERVPGIVELTGVGKINSTDPARRYRVQCEIDTPSVEALVGMDQRISISYTYERPLNTCRKPPVAVR